MKIVLAYSGGLDTSVLLSWIKEKYNAEMIAFCANIGQEDELDGLEAKAKKTGASKVYIDDLQEEFARDFIFPMLHAGAIYEGQYFLGTSIARPLIAKRMVEIAKKEKADAIAHGATGKGNDQVRFELTAAALAPDLQVIAPWRDERYRNEFPGRQEMIDYCAEHKIDVQASAKKPFSMDRNLLHISYEAGILEDPWMDAGDLKFRGSFTTLSVFPEDAPNKPEFVTLDFLKGNCVAVNGKKLSPLGVMQTLNKLGGKHGVGRVDMVENRYVGMKSRGVYETPGGAILHFAHRQMETLTMDREVMHLRDSLIPKYAELVYYGYWFAPERLALQALVTESQKNITGTVRVKLYKGNIMIAGRKSSVSLYNPHIATMEADPTKAYNQDDATGFIRLNALRLKVAAKVQRKVNVDEQARFEALKREIALGMNFRCATLNDCALLAELNHQLIRDEGHRNKMTVPELEQRMRDWLASEYAAIIFEDRGEIIAYALYRNEADELYLRQLFVVPNRRHQGIGRAAMEILRKQIWPKDKRLTVSVLVQNTAAVAFWRAVGYQDYSLALEILRSNPL